MAKTRLLYRTLLLWKQKQKQRITSTIQIVQGKGITQKNVALRSHFSVSPWTKSGIRLAIVLLMKYQIIILPSVEVSVTYCGYTHPEPKQININMSHDINLNLKLKINKINPI